MDREPIINMEKNYHRLLDELIENALLHLYFNCLQNSPRRTPRHARNAVLVKYLKPFLKSNKYKTIKKDVKIMVLTGQKAASDLEQKLLEIQRLSRKAKQNVSDAHRLYQLLNILFDQYGIDSKIFKDKVEKSNTIYLLQDHLEHCFEESGKQVAPVSLFMQCETENRSSEIRKIIKKNRSI